VISHIKHSNQNLDTAQRRYQIPGKKNLSEGELRNNVTDTMPTTTYRPFPLENRSHKMQKDFSLRRLSLMPLMSNINLKAWSITPWRSAIAGPMCFIGVLTPPLYGKLLGIGYTSLLEARDAQGLIWFGIAHY
jgi:hypothetical protein